MSTDSCVKIRPFGAVDADYEIAIAIEKAIDPDSDGSVTEWRHGDETRAKEILWGRFIAEDAEGTPVGFGGYGQSTTSYHPQKFHVGVQVRPDAEGKGVGRALYDRLMEAVTPLNPLILRSHVREDRPRAIRFADERGFVEDMRDWESRLDVAAFDPAPFAGAQARVAEQGIVIKPLSELTDDPEWRQKVFDLDWTITLDMPTTDVYTRPTLEHFVSNTLGSPNFGAESWFIALDGDNWVGISTLWNSQSTDDLWVGSTGVLREYRRRGIALALKLRAAEHAKAVGCPRIRTFNATTNRPMLSINEAMGFAKEPAWISLVKNLEQNAA